MILDTFLQVLAGAGAAGGVVVILGRMLIRHWLTKDVDRFRIELQAASERELERLRGELERQATEHRVRFTHLHERQATVIAEVFAGLERLHQSFKKWTAAMRPQNADMFALRDETATRYNEFIEYYYPNAIWLDRDTCNAINELVGWFWDSFVDFAYDLDDRGFPRDTTAWRAAWDKIQKEIPEARGQLDRRFREILGIQDMPASRGVSSD